MQKNAVQHRTVAELVQKGRTSFYLKKVGFMKKGMGVYYKRKCGVGPRFLVRKRRETERRRKGHELKGKIWIQNQTWSKGGRCVGGAGPITRWQEWNRQGEWGLVDASSLAFSPACPWVTLGPQDVCVVSPSPSLAVQQESWSSCPRDHRDMQMLADRWAWKDEKNCGSPAVRQPQILMFMKSRMLRSMEGRRGRVCTKNVSLFLGDSKEAGLLSLSYSWNLEIKCRKVTQALSGGDQNLQSEPTLLAATCRNSRVQKSTGHGLEILNESLEWELGIQR